MKKTFNGYMAGECTAFLLTLPIMLFFALIKYAIKIIVRHAKTHKKKNLKDMY